MIDFERPTTLQTAGSRVRAVAGEVARSIDEIGLERTWRSLMVHRVNVSESPDREIMLRTLRSGGGSLSSTHNLLAGLEYYEVGVLYEFSLAHSSHDARKEAGQFFTPDDVALEMALRARKIDDGSMWIDPCCGLGNLTYWLAKVQEDPANFLKTRMLLVDRDKLALLLAAVMLTLELGGATSGVFVALRSRSRARDFLSTSLPEAKNAIVNPPYVVVEADRRFGSSDSRDLYAYFIEHLLDTCRGIVSITPQSFTNGKKFSGLRELLAERLTTADIYCFDNVPDNIFKGVKFGSQNSNMVNSTRPAILVGTVDPSFNDASSRHRGRFRITPLMRWRASERATMFAKMDDLLTPFEPDGKPFPKVSPGQANLLTHLMRSQRSIRDLTSVEETDLALYVPTTPRYFITASKRALGRSSVRRLYFDSVKDQDLAYVILNSDLAYWWWRVFDGGMSLSHQTLMSIPVPDDSKVSKRLVTELEASERSNGVTKLNAGVIAENVKHPDALIRRLTLSLLGDDAMLLDGIRSNSALRTKSVAFPSAAGA